MLQRVTSLRVTAGLPSRTRRVALQQHSTPSRAQTAGSWLTVVARKNVIQCIATRGTVCHMQGRLFKNFNSCILYTETVYFNLWILFIVSLIGSHRFAKKCHFYY